MEPTAEDEGSQGKPVEADVDIATTSRASPFRPYPTRTSDSLPEAPPFPSEARLASTIGMNLNIPWIIACNSRNSELCKWFGLPPGETEIDDFNCALRKRVLLQGRLFVFNHYVGTTPHAWSQIMVIRDHSIPLWPLADLLQHQRLWLRQEEGHRDCGEPSHAVPMRMHATTGMDTRSFSPCLALALPD